MSKTQSEQHYNFGLEYAKIIITLSSAFLVAFVAFIATSVKMPLPLYQLLFLAGTAALILLSIGFSIYMIGRLIDHRKADKEKPIDDKVARHGNLSFWSFVVAALVFVVFMGLKISFPGKANISKAVSISHEVSGKIPLNSNLKWQVKSINYVSATRVWHIELSKSDKPDQTALKMDIQEADGRVLKLECLL